VRFALNFSTPYPPATDAGYYPMQTQAWLVQGRLLYDDLPLLFWLNAALAKLLTWTGTPFDAALLMASRVLDCILQPWTAAAVVATGYLWANGRRQALPGSVAAALLVVLSPPILRMLSDFQKNSFGFVWMAAAIWACRSAMAAPSAKRWMLLTAFMILSALTHVGAFAVTSLIVGTAMLIWYSRSNSRMFKPFLAAAGLVAALLFYFEPRRTVAILHAPLALAAGPILWTPLPVLVLAPFVIGIALRRVWRSEGVLPRVDLALIFALTSTLLVLICPKNLEYFDRLWLMAPVPAAFLIAFGLADLSVWSGAAALILAVFIAVLSPVSVQGPYMVEGAAEDLRHLRQQVAEPQSTLIVAPHGLEWWAGYFLDTPVRMKMPENVFGQYHRVLLLQHTRAFKPPGASPGFAPRLLEPPAQRIYAGEYLNVYELPAPAIR
jgi:hypothetical protein